MIFDACCGSTNLSIVQMSMTRKTVTRKTSSVTPMRLRLSSEFIVECYKGEPLIGKHIGFIRSLTELVYSLGQAGTISDCFDGHFADPYEQNTQQSPRFGFKTVLQFAHW